MAATSKPTAPSPADVYLRMYESQEAQANKSAKASDEETPATAQASRSSRIHQAALIAFPVISSVAMIAMTVTTAIYWTSNDDATTESFRQYKNISAAAYLANLGISAGYSMYQKSLAPVIRGGLGVFNLVTCAFKCAGKCKEL